MKSLNLPLYDRRRSAISESQVKKYKSEITKENVRSATSYSTCDLVKTGSEQMKADDYRITNDETILEI